jgi:hypothetical protein
MARSMFQPLLRKAPERKPQASRAARPVERIARQALIDRRDHCMAEIARFWSEPGNSASLFEKARQLLTRHWSASTWRARADILRTAEWLVGIGKKGAESPQACEGFEDGRIRHTRGDNIAGIFR